MEHLKTLQRLLADGFISAAEYDHRRQQLIDKLTNTTMTTSSLEDEEADDNRSGRSKERDSRRVRLSAREKPSTRKMARPQLSIPRPRSSTTTSTTLTSTRGTSHTQGLRFEPYNTSSSCAAEPVMDMAHKYTLSRKIGELPEEVLPSLLQLVERLSPKHLRQSEDDWTFDLETLEDRTLWRLNDFVNAQLKLHFGEKSSSSSSSSSSSNITWDNHDTPGMVEEEKSSASVMATESDPEDSEMENDDPGLDLPDDEDDREGDTDDARSICAQDALSLWPLRNPDELKAAKRPRPSVAPASGAVVGRRDWGDKRVPPRRQVYGQEESESDEGEDVGDWRSSYVRHTEEVTRLEKERDAVDEVERDSESEYEREEYEDPEYTTDTQPKLEDDDEEESDGDEEESDEDWTPADPGQGEDSSPQPRGITQPPRLQPLPSQAPKPKRETQEKVERALPLPGAAAKQEDEIEEKEEKPKQSAAPGKPFKIQVCVYSLAKKPTSNAKKPYVCDACDKAFADRSNLIQHLRVHTKEKPYVCTHDGCDKRFAHSASLKEHLHTHTGDKPHVCNFDGCGMSFAQASNLRRHQLVHTGEKPFVCRVGGCGKSFTQKINLTQHLKRVHKMTQQACDDEEGDPASVAVGKPRPLPGGRKRIRPKTSTPSHGTRGTSSASKLGSR